jgi:putative ABC transport system permease protein
MFKTTIKSLLARRFRLVTTAFAVLLGVAFMAGTLTLTDTVSKTFDSLFANVYAGTDAYVRSASTTGPADMQLRGTLPATTINTVSGADGVAAASGVVQGYAQLLSKTHSTVGSKSAPTRGLNWITNSRLNPFRIAQGHAPEAHDEIVIDRASATLAGYHPGDWAPVLTQAGPQRLRIVGIATFAGADSPAGSRAVLFTLDDAEHLVGQPGRLDAVAVTAKPGVTQVQLAQHLRHVLPGGYQVLTGSQITAQSQHQARQMVAGFREFLLAFALVSLFVGSFVIYNTFSILVAQRNREHALLRAIGASRRQVLASVVMESLAVGLIAVVAGIAGGLGMAALLKGLLAHSLVRVPTGDVVLSSSTIVACTVAGLGISVAAAVLPARKAARVAPVAALHQVDDDTPTASRRRAVSGLAVTLAGGALMTTGLFGHAHSALRDVGVGGLAVFVGVAILAPLVARPAARLLGFPAAAMGGIPGRLGRGNAMRQPKRTAATAASLMVGVALVGFLTVFAASAKGSFNASVHNSVKASFVITAGAADQGGGFQPQLTADVARVPGVKAVAGYRTTTVGIGTASETAAGVDPAVYPQAVDLGVTHGSLAGLGDDGVAVVDTLAARHHWKLGQTIPVRFAATGSRPLTLAAIYTQKIQAAPVVLGLAVYQANVASQLDTTIYVATNSAVSDATMRAALESATAAYPTASVETRNQYVSDQLGAINTLLSLVYVLLAFAVVVALLGISNTLALSLHERTRELGLLRAVGMTRRQLRAAVRHEAAVVASFGTVLGLGIGIGFGYTLVKAAHNIGIAHFTVPLTQFVLIAVVAALAGVTAAALPARRAGRLDVLGAIAEP